MLPDGLDLCAEPGWKKVDLDLEIWDNGILIIYKIWTMFMVLG